MMAQGAAANPQVEQGDLVIDVHGLEKSFAGRKAVDDFSIQVRHGEIYGFLGPNGSGKTTTIRMLCGLLTPDAGRGTCLGYDILRESAAIKRQVGYMTQQFSLYEDLSVRENLDFVARMYGMTNRKRAVDGILDRAGLAGRRDQLAGELSGGWKQRLMLGACILHEPKLLLLDEPTAGVDPKARREFWNDIRDLADQGLTVLVSTHYMDEAERCNEMAYLSFGRLLTHGTAPEVVAKSGLVTWQIAGGNLSSLAKKLTGTPGIEMVAPFGAVLHVSGTDAARLEAAIAPFRDEPGRKWSRSEPSLEDVFIHLTQGENAA